MRTSEIVDKLRKRLARDAKKYENMRTVYMYRTSSGYKDNILLLPHQFKDSHKEFFDKVFDSLSKEEKERFQGVEIVKIGVFDKTTFKLTPCRHVVIKRVEVSNV